MYRTRGIGSLSYKLIKVIFCPHDPTRQEEQPSDYPHDQTRLEEQPSDYPHDQTRLEEQPNGCTP